MLLLEREDFPRYHIGESLMPYTWFTFERLGVLDWFDQAACPKKYSVQFVSTSGQVSQPFYFFKTIQHQCATTWQVLRSDFDRMMLEIVEPPVTCLEIVRAALIPALLYYLSLLLIVHFYARRNATAPAGSPAHVDRRSGSSTLFEGIIFATALGSLILFLILGYTAFRAVTLSLITIVITSSFHPSTRLEVGRTLRGLVKASRNVVPLVAAAACVGIIIGVVTLTGIGTRLPATIIPLAEQSLFLALVLIMISSIILGMGLPSAVCYLLMATLIGPVLGNLGVIPLAAHLFIFYFGMMSMVTPPVALAAYAAASIAGTSIMPTAFAAFRFAIVGFTLP